MNKKIYVGNLPFSSTSQTLIEMFSAYGEVTSSKVIMDRDTGRSKGFGFVEMSNGEEADAAITQLHGSDFGGRSLTVNEARVTQGKPGPFQGASRPERNEQQRGFRSPSSW